MNLPAGVEIIGKHDLSPREVANVTQLVDVCNVLEGLDLPLPVSAESPFATTDQRHFLALEDERLIGYLGVQDGDELEICVAIDPERRRRGVGRRLLLAAAEAVRQQGTSHWLLVCDEASPSGRAFVQSVGAAYRNSEYRLQLDPQAVPGQRTWATAVRLRRGSADEVALVAHLNAASFGDNEDDVQRWVARAMALESHRFFIASILGDPIGCIRTNHDGTTMYITAFGVLPEFRGRGYGRQILLQIVDMLLREKWPTVRIEVATDNRRALELYLSCGFKEMTTYGYYVQKLGLDESSRERG